MVLAHQYIRADASFHAKVLSPDRQMKKIENSFKKNGGLFYVFMSYVKLFPNLCI